MTKGHVALPNTGERINCLIHDRGGNSVYTQYVGPITSADRILPHEASRVWQAVPYQKLPAIRAESNGH